MSWAGKTATVAFAVSIALVLCGCGPAQWRPADEQKEPFFLLGKKKVAMLDYKGAAEAFEKALEFNPRNASAHFELALLYEKDETDLVGAIYHFDRYLRLRPDAPNAEIVKDRLLRCKQLLATKVQPISATPALQRELERLTAENRELRRQLDAWQALYGGVLQQSPTGQLVQATVETVPRNVVSQPVHGLQPAQPVPAAPEPQVPPAQLRRHTVQPGESPYSIARKYGVKLDALLAANPGIEPRRLRVGQTLIIPAQ
ncbi:MAG: LysM peptidoglycan-binding domain-containing protein [Verrucomicrobiae bacterium]|nr:LysM peptidoglycan-binding domain-containing protein [Verrucomicrobiae bacterium]